MIKAYSRAQVATAIRAALVTARVFLKASTTEDLQVHLMDHLNKLAVEIEPPKMVPQADHDLLQMKYNTAIQLLKVYADANAKREVEREVGTGSRGSLCEERLRLVVPTGT